MRMPKSVNTVRRQIEAKIRSLGEAGVFMSGSFIEKRWKCAKPDCICNRTGKKHTAYAVTSKVKGKTKSVYVPVGMAEEVKGWVREYKRIQKTMKEVNALAEQLIRLQVPVARAGRQRKRSLESTTATSSES
jgi:hypothetical protein